MTAPLRVLHVITGLRTGGAETMLCKLLEAEHSGEIDARVLTLEGRGALAPRLEAAGIQVHSLGLGEPGGWRSLVGACREALFGDWAPSVCQGWMYHGNLAAWMLSKAWPACTTSWNIRQSLADPTLEKPRTWRIIQAGAALSRDVPAIICNSRASMTQHLAVGFHDRRWHILPNGFDLEVWRANPAARDRLRVELGLQPGDFLIGQIARFHPMKDHAGVLEAFARAAPHIPGAKLVLVGSGSTEDQSALAEALQTCPASTDVYLLGERRDLPWITAGLDVLVSGSAYGEGFPNVIGEALACEVPVVATDVGDSAWALGGCGHLTPPREPKALASALVALHALGPDGRASLGRQGRLHVRRHFSIGAVTAAYRALHQELSGK